MTTETSTARNVMTAANKLRTVRFSPYRKGMGPTFTLTLWDAGSRPELKWSRNYLAYRLTMSEQGKTETLFEGADIGLGMFSGDAIDSDASVRAAMGWLTLKPGDTDEDYFAAYTPAQLDYCSAHAESLSCEVANRFGEE